MNRTHIIIALTLLTLLTAPLLAADDNYKPVLGNLWVGTKLFDKTTHEFFGTVKSIEGKTVTNFAQMLTVLGTKYEGDAIKIVAGDGSREMVVFEESNTMPLGQWT